MSILLEKLSAVEDEQIAFMNQLLCLAILGVAAAGVGIIELVFPNFFNYPYFTWGGIDSVLKFWPLFLWGASLSLAMWFFDPPQTFIHIREHTQLFGWKLVTSTFAGIWEELAYRWAFICYCMIGIAVFNWIFSSFIGWILAGFLLISTIALWNVGKRQMAVFVFVAAVLAALFAIYADPIYWLNQLLVWVMHYTTLTLMDSVFYNGHEELFIFGAVVANARFRDGHKYQGFFGWVNSWYGGMILLYATVTYGLITAIVVHALYNIVITVCSFALQRIAPDLQKFQHHDKRGS